MGRTSLDAEGSSQESNMTNGVSWTDIPELALNTIFMKLGLHSLGQCFMVCKRWLGMKDQDEFWKALVKSEFGFVRDDYPAHVGSWAGLARFLHTQRISLIELGPKQPKEIKVNYSTEVGFRGLLDSKMCKVMECVNGDIREVFVFMGVTASNELLVSVNEDMCETIDAFGAFESYSGAFQGWHCVEDTALEVSGAMVCTFDGELYQTTTWGHVESGPGDFVVEFQKVDVPSDEKVISFAMCCSGVRVAALAGGSVFVWGKVYGMLFEQMGMDPCTLFGLGEGSVHVVSDGPSVMVTSPVELQFVDLPQGDTIVQVMAGNSHFLARSQSGSIWAWGFSGCDSWGTTIQIASMPALVACPAIQMMHNSYMLETLDAKLLAYAEFVCGGGNQPIWTPMYNLGYGVAQAPEMPNAWPWIGGALGAVRAHGREIGEMPLSVTEPLASGCVAFTRHNSGCVRLHVYSNEECMTSQEPLHVHPMFDMGPEVHFGTKGNLYFGGNGRVVVKDARRPLVKDQFYLLDLKSLGVPTGGHMSIERPWGGWLLTLSTSG